MELKLLGGKEILIAISSSNRTFMELKFMMDSFVLKIIRF